MDCTSNTEIIKSYYFFSNIFSSLLFIFNDNFQIEENKKNVNEEGVGVVGSRMILLKFSFFGPFTQEIFTILLFLFLK